MNILESLRKNAARKSEFDTDKELLTRAADEIQRLQRKLAAMQKAKRQLREQEPRP